MQRLAYLHFSFSEERPKDFSGGEDQVRSACEGENAWCNEDWMLHWVNHMWKCPFSPNAEKPKLLIADVHKAQKTTKVLNALEACKTTVVLVPLAALAWFSH